jgi:hypothetical protein
MSAIDTTARDWVIRLEDAEKRRSGVPLQIARRAVARKIGAAPGTLENIRRGRTKGVRGWIFERLSSAVVAEIQFEIASLEHDLQMARQSGVGAHEGEIRAMDSRRADLRAVIRQ